MVLRITTALVLMIVAIVSDVTGPRISAMCRSTCSTPDNRLSRLMHLHMLRDTLSVKGAVLSDEEDVSNGGERDVKDNAKASAAVVVVGVGSRAAGLKAAAPGGADGQLM